MKNIFFEKWKSKTFEFFFLFFFKNYLWDQPIHLMLYCGKEEIHSKIELIIY